MIAKMTKYSFVLPSSLTDDFLVKLQSLNVLDISRSTKPVDDESERILGKIEAAKEDIRCIEKGIDDTLRSLSEERSELARRLADVEPWGEYDADKLSAFEIHWYCMPASRFNPVWEAEYALVKVYEKEDKVWFVTAGPEIIPGIAETVHPEASASQLRGMLLQKDNEIAEYRQRLEERSSEIPDIKENIARLTADLNLYLASITSDKAVDNLLTLFVAFAPSSDDKRLEEELNKMDGVVWFAEKATPQDNPPIKLQNGPFARQFEVLTGMYGMPVYDEFDPTPVLGPFFLLFFSLCMGDAGYGILLFIISMLLKGKSGGLGKSWRLVRFLGVGTFVVGILLGTFFGISLYAQEWVPDWLKRCMLVQENVGTIAGYDPQMVMALLIGIVHISLAMIVKAICNTRRFGFKENLSVWGWTLLVVGGVIVAAVSLAGWLPQEALKWVIIGVGGISALGIFIFNKPGRNPLLNIGAGLWDSYQMATGILGDVLSYIRLYALGLAGGMLGGAFNELALMVRGDSPTWQWLPFVVIAVIGHALNLAMSCLGAFVHPLRLTFVEYFKNSGYEGRGTKYNPLKK